jgi:hypothetical protein
MAVTPRRFRVGEAVIWTNFADGTRHETTVLAHVEPGTDDYDAAAHGPLYEVTLRGRRAQVAEEDLSPWPRPRLTAAPDPERPAI